MRRAPEYTALVDAKTPGYFVILDQTQKEKQEALVVFDFNKKMLLAAVMGAHLSGDGSTGIAITEVREFADRMIVTIRKNNSVPFGYQKNFRIFPLDVIAVPKSDKPVFFIVNEYTAKTFTRTSTIYPIFHHFTGLISNVDTKMTKVTTDESGWQAL